MECKNGKPALTITEQIDLLLDRGLKFRDENSAYYTLSHINYYRLSGYFNSFYENDQEFKSDIFFEDIYDCYQFDMYLRRSTLMLLESVEVSLKAIITDYLCNQIGPLSYKSNDIYYRSSNVSYLEECMQTYKSKHADSKIIQTHEYKYSGEYPLWALMEFLSFGDVASLLEGLKFEHIDEISNGYFRFPNKRIARSFLVSWYRSLCMFRNKCSHYERLFQVEHKQRPPKLLHSDEFEKVYGPCTSNETYFYLLSVTVMLCPDSSIVQRFNLELTQLMTRFPNIDVVKNYCFKDNWQRILLDLTGFYLQYYIDN
ncbi:MULTISPECIES: Abi family protein [Breznakia]|uniref:Abortive infection bacteriophage resistance protein n=1 Tax=Breznakia blatticola TaxID=1754012 RepID=A0A4R8A343_9FIRM|nr:MULTISPECIES: Abi family protein [Breznakia]MDH6366152.1 abortive infection bacteriophage resistance protein [Breznakia sp. PH1-1]MDH6403245.1 abortive infection bacteriophage resistance protein [Breznakia sp. PF1-11]MDH6410954.1 abortive infection bacteriophage resistance protein [Breznakia sp. PFB1-11]MDH6413318.1 abortive infection bacteriophage resistance protein [Breznakia sp. PFB1-14]MDH6416083.1 abortive infection bacteriophage resistance protein [Breznakia sp. PFB1-4]